MKTGRVAKFWLYFVAVAMMVAATVTVESFEGAQAETGGPVASVTYTRGTLHASIPYDLSRKGAGRLTVEVVDPENRELGRVERQVDLNGQRGSWQVVLKLSKALSTDDLVWHRLHYRFDFADGKGPTVDGVESISQILRMPMVHILGQTSYLTGGAAAVRVIVTDSRNEMIGGASSVRIELAGRQDSYSFHGKARLAGNYRSAVYVSGRTDGQLSAALRGGHGHRIDRVYAAGSA